MSDVSAPTEKATQAELEEWYKLDQEIREKKEREVFLRFKIFKTYFPDAKEGTNNFPMEGGWVLKGNGKINRSIDEAALTELASVLREHKINVKDLVKYKPELSTTNYRTLTDEQRHLFDKCLVIKEGTPSLEIVKPKRAVQKT